MKITIKKGLDIPIEGAPEQVIEDAPTVSTVGVVGAGIVGLRPSMLVAEGDRVRLGQTLFVDKGNTRVAYTAPGAGEVMAINRGARRALQSVVIRLEGDEAEEFEAFDPADLSGLDEGKVREQLLASGFWPALRARPFSRVAHPDGDPAAIFVTATDTNPLAADPAVIVGTDREAFVNGLAVISRLTAGEVFVCTAPGADIPVPEGGRVRRAEFAGPHPAGLVGTHIHFLKPVSESRYVWHVGYQHVMGIGRLFTTGRAPTEKIVAISGPMMKKPRLLRTRRGVSTSELLHDETQPGRLRVISGSVLSGHSATGPLAYVGRYHNQITVLAEGREREFLSWMRPGSTKYSAIRAYAGHLLHKGRFPLTTSQMGSPRAMVSIGTFERIMPLDILPTPLLKALLVEDTDRARELGCLELDEEDLALCSFVCNGKYDYGPFLRMNLDEIEANG